ncbi:TlpA disulfide reductase family protein [Mucilaginibacter sp. SG564]|uniref:TlpA disulfide reductase family protein n=1 Tax=unclassified Mucilaginibacter TaxID=2617802 RepID=UPI001553F13F|nr:TlpA disulfide reductase family protein [Mucilaginibacter sp. SG564]NOW95730.1 peroxiredoxin [Mucilaginibacter sp. SG564]
MKNRIIASGVFLLAIFLFSCKDKSSFTISGVIKNPAALKMVYLLEADSSQVKVIDSTTLSENGKFQFKHQTLYSNLYKLRVSDAIYDLIAKNGDDIDFSTDLKDNTHSYIITGSDDSDKIKEFNKISNFYGEKNNKVVAEYQEKSQALGKQSDSLLKVYMPIFQKNMADYGTAVLKFVNDNKKSLAGFYAATSLDVYKYEPQLVAYADEIKGSFQDNPGVQQFIKQMEKAKPVSVGHKAPDFTIGGIDGKPIKLSDYKGKYVMIDFWASWCMPCRQENPNVVKQYNAFKSKGFNILGVSLDKETPAWKKAIDDDKLTWAHGSDLKGFEGPTEALYHIEAIPSNFIIDPQGNIVAKNITGADLEAFLNKTFSKPQ